MVDGRLLQDDERQGGLHVNNIECWGLTTWKLAVLSMSAQFQALVSPNFKLPRSASAENPTFQAPKTVSAKPPNLGSRIENGTEYCPKIPAYPTFRPDYFLIHV